MRRRFRRRSRPVWYPPLGSSFTVQDDTSTFGGVTFSFITPGSGAIGFTEVPLTFDVGQEAILADAQNQVQQPTLSDLQNSAWRLRRVVGRFFVTYHPQGSGREDAVQNQYPAVAFAAGLMVRKVSEFAAAQTNVDIWNRDDYDDPWIWRNSWILGQDARLNRYNDAGVIRSSDLPATGNAGPLGDDTVSAFVRFPNTNCHYPSGVTGPMVDQKTNRIIGPEDRLFMHLAVKGLPVQPLDPPLADLVGVVGMWDLRYLGFPQRSTNRRNASR